MTDKPTPTDAELKAMWQLHAADIGGHLSLCPRSLGKVGPARSGGRAGGGSRAVPHTIRQASDALFREAEFAHRHPALHRTPAIPHGTGGRVRASSFRSPAIARARPT